MSPARNDYRQTISITVGGVSKSICLRVKLAGEVGYFKDEKTKTELLSLEAGVQPKSELL